MKMAETPRTANIRRLREEVKQLSSVVTEQSKMLNSALDKSRNPGMTQNTPPGSQAPFGFQPPSHSLHSHAPPPQQPWPPMYYPPPQAPMQYPAMPAYPYQPYPYLPPAPLGFYPQPQPQYDPRYLSQHAAYPYHSQPPQARFPSPTRESHHTPPRSTRDPLDSLFPPEDTDVSMNGGGSVVPPPSVAPSVASSKASSAAPTPNVALFKKPPPQALSGRRLGNTPRPPNFSAFGSQSISNRRPPTPQSLARRAPKTSPPATPKAVANCPPTPKSVKTMPSPARHQPSPINRKLIHDLPGGSQVTGPVQPAAPPTSTTADPSVAFDDEENNPGMDLDISHISPPATPQPMFCPPSPKSCKFIASPARGEPTPVRRRLLDDLPPSPSPFVAAEVPGAFPPVASRTPDPTSGDTVHLSPPPTPMTNIPPPTPASARSQHFFTANTSSNDGVRRKLTDSLGHIPPSAVTPLSSISSITASPHTRFTPSPMVDPSRTPEKNPAMMDSFATDQSPF